MEAKHAKFRDKNNNQLFAPTSASIVVAKDGRSTQTILDEIGDTISENLIPLPYVFSKAEASKDVNEPVEASQNPDGSIHFLSTSKISDVQLYFYLTPLEKTVITEPGTYVITVKNGGKCTVELERYDKSTHQHVNRVVSELSTGSKVFKITQEDIEKYDILPIINVTGLYSETYKAEEDVYIMLEKGNTSHDFKSYSKNVLKREDFLDDGVNIKIAYDEDGNLGYKKDGADTVTPFKSWFKLAENVSGSQSFNMNELHPAIAGTLTANNFLVVGYSGSVTSGTGSYNGLDSASSSSYYSITKTYNNGTLSTNIVMVSQTRGNRADEKVAIDGKNYPKYDVYMIR